MIYSSIPPSLALSDFVRNYTIIDLAFNNQGKPAQKQRAPKPEQKIVFYLKELPDIFDPATGMSTRPPRISIFSHQEDKRIFKIPDQFFTFIIFLQPGALHRLIRLPMIELLHGYWNAEDFFGKDIQLIFEQLCAAATPAAMINIAENFLLNESRTSQPESAVDKVACGLLSDPSSLSLDEAAQQAFLGTKQFYRKFLERIGISPKFFSRLSRFNYAYRYKIQHPHISWSSIAMELQYTDYHHLEKEFKAFTHLTPHEWTNTHMKAPERILQLR